MRTRRGPNVTVKKALLSSLFALLFLMGTPAFGGESLETLLQKRTLDVVQSKEPTLAGALSELAARYKAKYGEELPVFISVELLPDTDAPKPKSKLPPIIPGITPSEPFEGDPAGARLDDRVVNVPIIEILHLYAGLTNSAYTIQGDFVVFHKPK